jgi:hypothetical protein
MGTTVSNPTGPGSAAPSDEPDELRAIDRAMLAAIAGHQRAATPLSYAQEALLDEWVAGRLSAADADRAETLTRQNTFAAERVLERRLVEAANAGPGVPAQLSAQVLSARASRAGAAAAARAPADAWESFRSWLGSLSGLQWSAAGAAFAATIAFAVVSFQSAPDRWLKSGEQIQAQRPDQSVQVGQSEPPAEAKQPERRIQIAMVTIDERAPLSGRSSTRELRSPPPGSAENAYRDLDIPADVLRRVIADADGADRTTAASQLSPYWPPLADAARQEAYIMIDSVLADRLKEDWKDRDSIPIRIFDLNDPRAAQVRRAVNRQVAAGPHLLLTLQP